MNRLMTAMAGAALLPLAASAAAQNESDEPAMLASAPLAEATDASAPTRPGEYTIKLTRPMKVGTRMRVSCVGTEVRRVMSVDDGIERPAEAFNMNVTLDAEAEVREVDATGRPVRMAYTIDTCTMNIDGNGVEIAPKRARVTARRDGTKTVFEIDGRPVGPTEANALGLVITLPAMQASDDDLMGSERPRSIGESWAIDAERTAAELKRLGGVGRGNADVWGVTTLVERQDRRGHPCLLIQSQVTTENMVPGLAQTPSGMKLMTAMHTMMSQRLFPEDERMPSLSDFTRTDVNVTFAPKSGRGPAMKIGGFRMTEVETTMLSRTTDASGAHEMTEETGATEAMASAEPASAASETDAD